MKNDLSVEFQDVAKIFPTPEGGVVNLEHGRWKGADVLGPEAFDPLPFMEKMADYGFPYGIKEM